MFSRLAPRRLRRTAVVLLIPAITLGILRLHARQAAGRYKTLALDGRFVACASKNSLLDFHARFETKAMPRLAILTIAASPAASLSLNGRPVYRGGLQDHDRAIALLRVESFLQRGPNQLTGTLQNIDAKGGILFEMRTGDGRLLVASGPSTSFEAGETLLRRGLPFAPWRKTKGFVSLLPLARLNRPETPAKQASRDDNGPLFDFGSVAVGYPIIRGAPPGTKVFYGESREEALSQEPFEQDTVAAFDRGGISFLRRSVRFVRLSQGATTAKVSILPVAYPAKALGSFRSSDSTLDRAYQISRRTILGCSQSFLEDGPKRDRAAWGADLLVEAPAALYLFGPSGIVKRTLDLLASDRTADLALPPAYPYPRSYTLPSYTAAWLIVLERYARLSGDRETVDALRPVIKEQAAWLQAFESGSIQIGKGPISSWLSEPSAPKSSPFRRALSLLGRQAAARLLGDDKSSRALRTESRRFLGSLTESRDGLIAGRHDATIAACLVATGQRRKEALLEAVRQELWTPAGPRLATGSDRVAPFLGGLEALVRFRSGDSRRALELIRNLYGRMTASGGVYEFSTPSGDPYAPPGDPFRTSLNHGWSAAPAWLLPAYILGVREAGKDGFDSFLVEPDLAGLSFVEGAVPTVSGPIEVSVRQDADDFLVAIRCPETARGKLSLHRLVPGSTIQTAIPRGGGTFRVFASDRSVLVAPLDSGGP